MFTHRKSTTFIGLITTGNLNVKLKLQHYYFNIPSLTNIKLRHSRGSKITPDQAEQAKLLLVPLNMPALSKWKVNLHAPSPCILECNMALLLSLVSGRLV